MGIGTRFSIFTSLIGGRAGGNFTGGAGKATALVKCKAITAKREQRRPVRSAVRNMASIIRKLKEAAASISAICGADTTITFEDTGPTPDDQLKESWSWTFSLLLAAGDQEERIIG